MNNLRGYLLKEKSTASPFGDTNKRWFEIESSSTTKDELILSYYKRPPPLPSAAKNASRRGFIFVSDIQKVEEDAVCKWITISHPRRTFRLQALDRKDHRKWFEELSRLVKENDTAAAGVDDDDDDKGEQVEQQFDGVDGSVNAQGTPTSASSSGSSTGTVVSTTIHKLPHLTGMDDANQSRASIEIDFLRRINQSTGDSKSPKKRQSTTTPKMDRQISRRDTPLANRVGHAIEKADHAVTTTSSQANGKPVKRNGQAAESPLWQRHKNRMLLLDESSSSSDCSSNESPPRNESLLTNKSFADLEDLISPTGLDTFISKTNRSSVVGNNVRSDAESLSDEDSFGGVW